MTTHYTIQWLIDKYESGDTLKYIFFWGHTKKNHEEIGKHCLSQWFESPFTVEGITYKTAEHWMMARKALLFEDQKTFDKIISCTKPAEAKELGRSIPGFDDQVWNQKRYEIVKIGSIHKFNQHPALADYLLKTENRILVEASPVDTIWGIGLAPESEYKENIYAWRGQNLLGFALMEARDFLQSFGHFEPLSNSMQPAWKMFPGIDPYDMFWRMGRGEDYLMQFLQYYQSLTEREKTIFDLTNIPPIDWADH